MINLGPAVLTRQVRTPHKHLHHRPVFVEIQFESHNYGGLISQFIWHL